MTNPLLKLANRLFKSGIETESGMHYPNEGKFLISLETELGSKNGSTWILFTQGTDFEELMGNAKISLFSQNQFQMSFTLCEAQNDLKHAALKAINRLSGIFISTPLDE